MSAKETSRLNDSMIPDSVVSNAMDPPISLNSDDETSQVDYLGTTFFSEDWGDDPFGADDEVVEKNDDGEESWSECIILEEKHGAAKNNHEKLASWDDEVACSMKMAAEKRHDDLLDEESWGEHPNLVDEKGAPKRHKDLMI